MTLFTKVVPLLQMACTAGQGGPASAASTPLEARSAQSTPTPLDRQARPPPADHPASATLPFVPGEDFWLRR